VTKYSPKDGDKRYIQIQNLCKDSEEGEINTPQKIIQEDTIPLMAFSAASAESRPIWTRQDQVVPKRRYPQRNKNAANPRSATCSPEETFLERPMA